MPRRQRSACSPEPVISRGKISRGSEYRQQIKAAVASCRNVVGQEVHHCTQYMLCALSSDLASSSCHGRPTRKVDVDHEHDIVRGDRLLRAQAPEGIRSKHQRCADEALCRRAGGYKYVGATFLSLLEHRLRKRTEGAAIREDVNVVFSRDEEAEEIA